MDHRLDTVDAYLTDHPDAALTRLREQLATSDEPMFARSNMTGHITASGLVVAPTGEVLLVHHLGLGKWLAPGGHVDEGDALIWEAAAREIAEETGVTGLALHPWHAAHDGQPIDVDTHAIPARPEKGEGKHFHHDALFVFTAEERAVLERQEAEVSAVAWVPINDPRVPGRLRRALAQAPILAARERS
jgi:8-oxo-dGTP pyrophosphatase MutT (NUDIX family)